MLIVSTTWQANLLESLLVRVKDLFEPHVETPYQEHDMNYKGKDYM